MPKTQVLIAQIRQSQRKNMWSLVARFMGPTWGTPGADRTQVGPMLPHELCSLGCIWTAIIDYTQWRLTTIVIVIVYLPLYQNNNVNKMLIKAHVMALWEVLFFIMRQSANFKILLVNVIHVPSWELNGNRLSQRVYHGNHKGSSIFYVTRNDGRLQWLANVQDYMYVCACVFQRKRGDSLVKRDIIHFRP